MTSFEDHFSTHTGTYAQYRPRYPRELFAYLASLAPGRQLAWDCATGNGQAAIDLVEHFGRVVATDGSAQQLTKAFPHERIHYWAALAEASGLKTSSVDLVTVAVAVHWFDFEVFYEEIKRVLKPDGILAVWTYHTMLVDPTIDPLLIQYKDDILAGYWPPRIRYLNERYTTLPFPFEELQAPRFEILTRWNLDQVIGFLDSWSATRRYLQTSSEHPIKQIWQPLSDAWGDPQHERLIHWPLDMRIGKNDGSNVR